MERKVALPEWLRVRALSRRLVSDVVLVGSGARRTERLLQAVPERSEGQAEELRRLQLHAVRLCERQLQISPLHVVEKLLEIEPGLDLGDRRVDRLRAAAEGGRQIAHVDGGAF